MKNLPPIFPVYPRKAKKVVLQLDHTPMWNLAQATQLLLDDIRELPSTPRMHITSDTACDIHDIPATESACKPSSQAVVLARRAGF